MSSNQTLLARRPITFALVATAATAVSLFVLYRDSTPSTATRRTRRSNRSQSLQRSGAVRRRRPQANVRILAGSANEFSFGTINISLGSRHSPPADLTIPLLLTADTLLPTHEQLSSSLGVDVATASDIHRAMLKATMDAIISSIMNGIIVVPPEGNWAFLAAMTNDLLTGISSETIAADYHVRLATALHSESLEQLIVQAIDAVTLPSQLGHSLEPSGTPAGHQRTTTTPQSHTDELKGVLYYIAEEQAKRKAYQHRGIRCEECGESPIRNIRWHCLHCADFDLCSTCKSLTTHKRNHIFAEIRIPLPVLAQPTVVLPAWYPGSDIAIHQTLSAADRRSLAHTYGCDEAEIDALAEQFVCFANAEAVAEPSYIPASIDRFAFGRAISSEKYRSRFHGNLFCDQMFNFYDRTKSGHIGFEQFVSGSCYLRGKSRDEASYLARSLEVFDLNEDGLICRSFFLRLLKAKYDLHRVLIADIAEADEAERTRQNVSSLHGTQPIGTMFHGDIPQGLTRAPTGKRYDQHGDAVADNKSIRQDAEKLSSLELLTEDDRLILGLDTTAPEQRRRIVDESLLWSIVDESLNEVLDLIFKPVEVRFGLIEKTKKAREQWRELIESEIEKMKATAEQDVQPAADASSRSTQEALPDDEVVSLQAALQQGMVPTDHETLERMEESLGNQSLESLLESSGYSVTHDRPTPLDPTMPQNKPNREPDQMTDIDKPPDDVRLRQLATITLDERQMIVRNKEPCLTKAEIINIAKADASGATEGLIRSWVSWAAF